MCNTGIETVTVCLLILLFMVISSTEIATVCYFFCLLLMSNTGIATVCLLILLFVAVVQHWDNYCLSVNSLVYWLCPSAE